MKNTLTKVTFFAAVLMLLGGCATVEQVNEAKSMAENAQAAAAAAAAAAADSATAAANQAMDAARAAQAAADAANACCSENSSKLDRMFEKAMQK